MTIASTTTRSSYAGDGSTTAFNTGFKFLANSHVEVVLRVDSTGAETTKSLTTHYTLTGAGDASGTVTMLTAPASGETLIIRRVAPNTQGSALPLGGAFPSTTVEEALDLAAMRDQQLKEEIGRALKFPVSDSSALDAELPSSVDRASKYLAFDADGNVTATAGTTDATVHNAFMTTLHSDATAAAARSTLGAAGLADANVFTKTQSWAKGADIASPAGGALTLGTDGNYFDITGTNAITSITTVGVGTVIKLHFDGALTLTHHATDLILPGGANITTAAGDEAEFIEYATGDWRCTSYVKASGATTVAASDTVAGGIETATQAEMEAGSSTSVAVTPGRAHFHPGMAKAWAKVTYSGGVPSLAAGHNFSSTITDVGTGEFTMTFTTAMSSADYCIVATAFETGSNATRIAMVETQAAGSFKIMIRDATGAAADADCYIVVFGDL